MFQGVPNIYANIAHCVYIPLQTPSVTGKSHHEDDDMGAQEAQAMFDWDQGYGTAYTQEQVDGKNGR